MAQTSPEKHEPSKSESKVYEGFTSPPGPDPKPKVFEGFTTPSPVLVPKPDGPPEPYNEPAYIQSLVEEGFADATDEAFRFHLHRFGGGSGAKFQAKESPKHEEPKHERKGH